VQTERKEVPTFEEWFNGRFWREWVVGRKNKPTDVRSKQIIYRCHLAPRFAKRRLDEITVSEVAQLRAALLDAELSEKRINNILAVLSKPLKYAVDCEVIDKAPRIGMFKCERPEIEAWTSRSTRVSSPRPRPRGETGTSRYAWPARPGSASARSRPCAGAKMSICRPEITVRIDETMLYVHVAENHRREIPESILAAAQGEIDPDRRILKMLAARGSHVAATLVARDETSGDTAS
jgi:hypothetical protein